MHHRLRTRAAVAGLLLAGCGGPSTPPSSAHPSSPAPRASPLTAPAPDPASLQAFVPDAERFVAAHRGLRFKRAVTVTTLDDAAFRTRLATVSKLDRDAISKAARELRALGLLSANVDLPKLLTALLGQAVEGFYDPMSRELVVRGVQATPYVREVVVHELTHALQDQWFEIGHPELIADTSDERPLALHALLEGDAVRIQAAYRASLSSAAQARAGQEELAAAGSLATEFPLVLLREITFPYTTGPGFVSAVLRSGGQPALDRAFTDLPVSSAQIIQPERWLHHRPPITVARPPSGGTVFDEAILGEFGLQLLLDDAAAHGQVSRSAATAAAAAWGGDDYVAWDAGALTCVRIAFAPDSPQHTADLGNALSQLAAHRPGVARSAGSPLVITSCG